VVARVNGDVVTLRQVRELCRQTGVSPEAALARLVDELLLAQYAEARGYAELRTTRRELERARVRALLEQAVEADGGASAPPGQRLEQLLTKLRRQTEVIWDEASVRAALSDPALLGPGT
jgi:hypothetical protein